MTNDKAISLLRAMQEPGPWDPQITEPAFEALEMAIEALEHTGDCILEQFGECSYIETGCGDCKVKRRISEALELKSRKGRWIPVTRIYKVTEGHFPKMHIKWVDAIEPDDIDGARGIFNALPSAEPEYKPVTAEDFAKTMSENTIYDFVTWHSEALTLMNKMGFVICKKTM